MPSFPLDDLRWWPVRNATSEAIPAYAVMKITSEEVHQGRTRFIVGKPDTTFLRKGYLINGPSPIAAGKTGSATRETAYALCSSSASPTREESWGPKSGEWKLFQYRPGFYMLGNYQGDGAKQRAIVEMHEVTQLWGTLDGSLSQGSSATMSVFFRDGGSWTDSTMNVTVYDRLMKTGQSIASGKWVVATWYGDRWWVQEAECP